jgi:hypothetical protein
MILTIQKRVIFLIVLKEVWKDRLLLKILFFWVERYEELEEIKRFNKKLILYKITKEQVKIYTKIKKKWTNNYGRIT